MEICSISTACSSTCGARPVRHIDISQSTATIATLLAEHFPIGQLLVRRIDRERSCLETVAVGLPDAAGGLSAARTPCSAAQLQWPCWRGAAKRGFPPSPRRPGDPLAPILAATLGGDDPRRAPAAEPRRHTACWCWPRPPG